MPLSGKKTPREAKSNSNPGRPLSQDERKFGSTISLPGSVVKTTPKLKETQNLSASSHDISGISCTSMKAAQVEIKQPLHKTGGKAFASRQSSCAAAKIVDPQDLADGEHTRYLQALFLEQLTSSANEVVKKDIDDQLATIQKRITFNQNILNTTNQRIRDITFLSEQQRLVDLQSTAFGDCLDKIKSTDCLQHLEDVSEQLERVRNQLPVENIGFPATESSLAEFQEILKDSLKSFEELDSLTGGQKKNYTITTRLLQGIRELDTDIETKQKEVLKMVPMVNNLLYMENAVQSHLQENNERE